MAWFSFFIGSDYVQRVAHSPKFLKSQINKIEKILSI